MHNVRLNRRGRSMGLALAALVLAAGAAMVIEAGAIGAVALRSEGAGQVVHWVRSLTLLSVGMVFGIASMGVPRLRRDWVAYQASTVGAR